MTLLSRFRWWRRLRGGLWTRVDDEEEFEYHPKFTPTSFQLARFPWWRAWRGGYWLHGEATWYRYKTPDQWKEALDILHDNGLGFLAGEKPLEQDLIRIVGTADPIEIRDLIMRPKTGDAGLPPHPTMNPKDRPSSSGWYQPPKKEKPP